MYEQGGSTSQNLNLFHYEFSLERHNPLKMNKPVHEVV